MLRQEKGITLVALVITVIILVILAAVSIASVFSSKTVNYAINGSQDYTEQARRENNVLNNVESTMDSAVTAIESITTNGQ